MIVDFDQAQDRLDYVSQQLNDSSVVDPVAEDRQASDSFGMLKCMVADSIDSICVQMPTTAEAIKGRVQSVETPEALGAIVRDLKRIRRPSRIQLAGEEDSAYFSALVDRTLLRSTFFRATMAGIGIVILLAAGIVGFRVVMGGSLQADVAAQLQANEERLLASQQAMSEIQRNMLDEIDRAQSIADDVERSADEIVEERERVQVAIAEMSTDAEELRSRLDVIRTELQNDEVAWRQERTQWEDELPQLQGFFEQQEGAVTARVATIVKQAESVATHVETTSGHALAAELALNAVQSAQLQIDEIKDGLEQRKITAEQALADASEAVTRLQQRLDSQSKTFDQTLSSAIALEADLRTTLNSLESRVSDWRERSTAATEQVEEAASTASKRILEESKEPLSVLTSRQNTAAVIVEGLQRGEQEVNGLLTRVRDLHADISQEAMEVTQAAEDVRTTLRETERQRELLQALVDQVDGRRDAAGAELERLLKEQPPLDLAIEWQSALRDDRSRLILAASTLALLFSSLSLYLSLRRRGG